MTEPASLRILPMGDRALLAEVADLDAVLLLRDALAASRPDGVVDLVPAARTVLVRVDPTVLSLAAAEAWIARAAGASASAVPTEAARVELDVVYDGPDLAATADLLGLSSEALAARHAAAVWRVAFTGFAPGFGYLVSLDWPFDLPRLTAPRTRVPAGSIGVAGGFSGAYPRESPGGWRLLGRTDAVLFDPAAPAPVLLPPGTEVRFRPVPALRPAPVLTHPDQVISRIQDESAAFGPDSAKSPDLGGAGRGRGRAIEVGQPGLLATVQDLGRPGRAALGIAGSGALDRGALRTANRLVGNPESAAGIEITLGGLTATARGDLWVAVCGAWGSMRIDGRAVGAYEAHPWPDGTRLEVDGFARGTRGYLAVRGGIAVPEVAGARSSDLLAGLGPAPLRAGDVLPVGVAAGPVPALEIAPWGMPHDDALVVELAPGPRADWFAASARRALFEELWRVTAEADRIGMRLSGPPLDRVRAGELPSEGMVPGAIQVPPSGMPTILLADGPVTGGYPVIAVVADASLDALAQARPGAGIRFRGLYRRI
ncbi:urea amidolyase family protein [Microbacterium sp. X-17]|uniref:5-oxoprolinase subunit B/C family protein n=1 Tax=Microbacterium sp. X-17 TaxID=3144404 RepID=UPI0031F51A4D